MKKTRKEKTETESDEEQAETSKASEVDEEDQNLEKKEEDDEEKEYDDSELTDDEKKQYRKLRAKMKKIKKENGTGESPDQSADASQTAEHTTTTDSVINTDQNVFVPQSDVDGKRTQDVPIEDPMSKSVDTNLLKSPLFVGINKQLDSMKDALSKKVDSVEKSVNDRIANMKADLEKTEKALEKFYNKPFYKAVDDSIGPEGTVAQSISKQIEEGKIKFRNK